MATERRSEHLRYRYGICLNENCPMCKEKTVQQIAARKDFVCTNPDCGKALRECPPPKKGMSKGLLAAIIAAVIAIIVACIFIFAVGEEEPKVQPDTTAIDTSAANKPIQEIVEEDSVSKDSTEAKDDMETTATEERAVKVVEKTVVVEKPVVVEKIVEKKVEKKTEKSSSPATKETPASGPKVSFGSYSGPANGMGGEISVTKSYSLDLRKGDGSSLDLQPGDKIRNTRFQNGELKQGVWVHNGEAQFFSR